MKRPASRSRPASGTPLVSLVVDPKDGTAAVHPDPIQNIFTPYGLSPALTYGAGGGCWAAVPSTAPIVTSRASIF